VKDTPPTDIVNAVRLVATDEAMLSPAVTRTLLARFADAAINDFSSALRVDPKLASALYGRGLARLKNGDKAGGDADISAAKAIQAGIDDDFMRYGVRVSN